jgi:hypothetical protein
MQIIDEKKLNEFVGRAVSDLAAGRCPPSSPTPREGTFSPGSSS